MLSLKNVTQSWGNTTVLSRVTLTIRPGDNLCIRGGSGSGKTTLLKLLCRLMDPVSGAVEADGVDLKIVPPAVLQLYRRRIGIVFQEPVLLEHATVFENVSLPLEFADAPPSLIRRGVTDLLQRLGLEAKASRFPSELSSSERMLVSIARAIAPAPMVLLLDEPFLPLDPVQASSAAQLFLALGKRGATIVSFSRLAETATLLSAKTLHLKDGKISGPPKEATSKTVSPSDHRILKEGIVAIPSEKRKIHITSLHSGV